MHWKGCHGIQWSRIVCAPQPYLQANSSNLDEPGDPSSCSRVRQQTNLPRSLWFDKSLHASCEYSGTDGSVPISCNRESPKDEYRNFIVSTLTKHPSALVILDVYEFNNSSRGPRTWIREAMGPRIWEPLEKEDYMYKHATCRREDIYKALLKIKSDFEAIGNQKMLAGFKSRYWHHPTDLDSTNALSFQLPEIRWVEFRFRMDGIEVPPAPGIPPPNPIHYGSQEIGFASYFERMTEQYRRDINIEHVRSNIPRHNPTPRHIVERREAARRIRLQKRYERYKDRHRQNLTYPIHILRAVPLKNSHTDRAALSFRSVDKSTKSYRTYSCVEYRRSPTI